MRVVSDTSPIPSLAIIDRMDLLRQQFKVLIPPVVLTELKAGIELPGAQAIKRALAARWLQVVLPFGQASHIFSFLSEKRPSLATFCA